VNDGVAAYEALLAVLSDTPTPAGPTPRQINSAKFIKIAVKEPQAAPAIRQAEK